MLPQNAPHFFDRLGMALRRVAGVHDFFGLDSFDMGALVSDNSIGLAEKRVIA